MLDEIRKQQEEQRARIAGTYIQKSEDNDIEKGGVGSGRHQIGTTTSGKAVIAHNGFNVAHQDFTSQDHKEAAQINRTKAAELRQSSKRQGGQKFADQADLHNQFAREHEAQAEKKSGIQKGEESQLTPQEHQDLIKGQINNTIGGKTLSLDELEKSATDYFEKGVSKHAIGEIKDFGGRPYIKTAEGWKYHGKGTGAKTQEHIKAALAHHVGAGKKESTPGDEKDKNGVSDWIKKEGLTDKRTPEQKGKERDLTIKEIGESGKIPTAGGLKSLAENLGMSPEALKEAIQTSIEAHKGGGKERFGGKPGGGAPSPAYTAGSKENVATKDSATADKNAEIHDLIKKHFPTATYDTKNSWYTVKNPKPGAKAAYQKEMMSKNHHGEGKVTDIFHDASELNIVIKK